MRPYSLLVILSLGACEEHSPPSAPTSQAPAGPPTVAVSAVVARPLAKAMTLPGELLPLRDVAVLRLLGPAPTYMLEPVQDN